MIELDCIQGSAEWVEARLGIPTASEFSCIVTPKRMQLSAQHADYLDQLLAEWVLGYREDDFKGNFWTERGHEYEPEAAAYYEQRRGLAVRHVGLCYRDEKRDVAASPDLLADPDGLVELKCPALKTHIGYLRNGEIPSEYIPQVQAQLWVTGRAWCDWMSYHPAAPAVLIRAEPDPKYQSALDEHVPAFLHALEAWREALIGMGVVPFSTEKEAA